MGIKYLRLLSFFKKMQDFFRFATTELDSSRVGCARLAMALLRSQYGHD